MLFLKAFRFGENVSTKYERDRLKVPSLRVENAGQGVLPKSCSLSVSSQLELQKGTCRRVEGSSPPFENDSRQLYLQAVRKGATVTSGR